MALPPLSPLCHRSRPALLVQPPAGVIVGGGSLPQSFLRNSRYSSRIIRCKVASSDCLNRRSRRATSLKIKVTAFRGYAQKLAVESSTKKREHHRSDEESINTYNRGSTDAPKWIGARKEDSTEVGSPQNVSSSSALGEADAVEEAGLDIVEGGLSGDVSNNKSIEKVDIPEAKDDMFVVDTAKKDIFGMDLAEHQSSSVTTGEMDTACKLKVDDDKFDVDLPGIALNKAGVEETVEEIDEAGTEEGIVDAVLLGVPSSSATDEKLDLKDESESIPEAFDADLSYKATSSGTHGEVVLVDETQTKKVTLEMCVSGISSINTRLDGMDLPDEAGAEKHTFEMVLLDGDRATKHMAVDSADKTVAEEANYQQQYTSQSETSMKVNDIDEAREILKVRAMPLAPDLGTDKLIFSDEKSILDFHRPVVNFHKQEHGVTAVDEHNRSMVGLPKQDLSIVHLPQRDNYILGFPKQDQSIVGFHKQEQSIESYYGQDTSIVGIPKQTQAIIRFSKPEQSIVASGNQQRSIVASRKQDRSIVCFREQKQSIVGFCKKDLSIVGTSTQVQKKQVAVVETDDTINVKFDVDRSLQKDKKNISEEAGDTVISKKDKHFLMIEEQKRASVNEEKRLVKEEGISVAEAQTKMDVDELRHLHLEEEISWTEDEVVKIKDEEQVEVDETSISDETCIQEPEADVDPQTRQRILQELAEEKSSLGNMLFLYPEVVKADSTIDLFLNRDLSSLANEPDVLIKGAFNGWKWRLFTERLHKSELGGDWWCCKLYIPKEAFRLDFVFFNGRTVYENNGNNDFVIQIESNMDEHLFEDFLAKEKQKELERLATEEAERRRKTEDQRRREEERAADEAIRAQAKVEVGVKKNKLSNILRLATTSVDNLWYIEPITTAQGSTVRLYYNRNMGSLAHSTEIWIHGGYNNWIDGLLFAERLAQHDDKDSNWWFADVVLPERAYVLDWVFADGPPGNARNFDNNDRQDFHAILPNIKNEVEYWMEEEQRIYTRLLQERREREEAVKRKAELSAKMKAEMKEKTMRMFLVSQKHIIYTEPLEIRAGTTVNVIYNPSNTLLNGKPEVWFRCSFNRWMHPGGLLLPQKMVKAENGSHLKATVNVPMDAYVMDFVFSESEEGGIYDNRNGLDYHIPVFGSNAKEPSMHIVHIAVEMAPIAKVGGLGDVVTSLSRAVQDLGHKVEVILPKHDCLNLSCVRSLQVHHSFHWGGTEIRVWFGLVEDVSVYFLEPQNGLFSVGCVYGRTDDRRFGFFCHSALEFLLQSGSSPDIIHCHDWSSAPVAWLCKEHYAQSGLADARVIFTIHNLEFGANYVGKAMKYCDKATTVSNTYSREVSGHGAIAPHIGKFFGILNGIDPDIWDPYNDSFIPVHYTCENVAEGKRAAKKALQQKLGLQQTDVPIVGIISRLTAQKGIHLIRHAIHHILGRNGQVVLLGSAPDHRIQNDFCNLANTLHGVNYGRVRMCLTYDEPLSHLIYAGADFILVPSMFEPCGLTQLVAMRYGAIPIVRKTGGLYDTVLDVEHDKDRARARGLEPNGFGFDGADTGAVEHALNRAITAWFDAREWFQALCRRVMQQDWSWNRPALDYIELYRSARNF